MSKIKYQIIQYTLHKIIITLLRKINYQTYYIFYVGLTRKLSTSIMITIIQHANWYTFLLTIKL